ncbi:MAG TPA: DUF3999 family protein [Sphingomonas sp.]|nr:DUF3999 family protein [Sphingomonas sp.]
MIGRRLSVIAGAAALLAAAPAGSDGELAGYRLRLPMSVEAGTRVQQLTLPPSVLVALQTRDGHDVRVFDARGRAMPIARGFASVAVRRDTLVPMPILGAPDALKISGVSLRLDGRGAAQVAEVRGEPVASGGAPVVLGVLLDVRALGGRADRVVVNADLPAGQPVTLVVEASGDLRDWRRLGEATVYRGAKDSASSSVVALDGAAVARDYLRITWRTGSRPITPIAIKQAVLETRPDGTTAGVTIDAQAPAVASTDAKTIDFAVPFAIPIARLSVVVAPDEGVIPVRILGRDDREQPWTVLGAGLATSDGTRGITLSGDTPRVMRIEADSRSPGFATAPKLRFGFTERRVTVLTSGTAPFTLAAGRADAKNVFLQQNDLTGDQPTLGTARATANPMPPLLLQTADVEGAATRSLILWGVLLSATVLLGAVAWLLWRQRPQQ